MEKCSSSYSTQDLQHCSFEIHVDYERLGDPWTCVISGKCPVGKSERTFMALLQLGTSRPP